MMITLGRMMKKAIDFFEQQANVRRKKCGVHPEIRNVLAQEMSIGTEKATATFHVEYAINGDYTESDEHPVYIFVTARGNQIEARWNPYEAED